VTVFSTQLCKMPFSLEDKRAIKVLRQQKKYGAEICLKCFLIRTGLNGLNTLLRMIDVTGNVERRLHRGEGKSLDQRVIDSAIREWRKKL